MNFQIVKFIFYFKLIKLIFQNTNLIFIFLFIDAIICFCVHLDRLLPRRTRLVVGITRWQLGNCGSCTPPCIIPVICNGTGTVELLDAPRLACEVTRLSLPLPLPRMQIRREQRSALEWGSQSIRRPIDHYHHYPSDRRSSSVVVANVKAHPFLFCMSPRRTWSNRPEQLIISCRIMKAFAASRANAARHVIGPHGERFTR